MNEPEIGHVPATGDNGTEPPAPRKITLPAAVIEHREAFRRFVREAPEEWHRVHLTRLYDRWEEWNEAFYGGELVPPYIMLSTPATPTTYGDCGPYSGFGGWSQIRIRESLVRGDHPRMGDRPRGSRRFYPFGPQEGRDRFVDDVLIHEMIHQWQQEVTGNTEEHYHGHGPGFRDKANAIGAILGLPRVRNSKKRGEDKSLSSCSQWPHCVRPDDYYLGSYRPERRERKSPWMACRIALELLREGKVAEAIARLEQELRYPSRLPGTENMKTRISTL